MRISCLYLMWPKTILTYLYQLQFFFNVSKEIMGIIKTGKPVDTICIGQEEIIADF